MNADSSYMQYISGLMNDDGFELPLGSRRFSISSEFDFGKETIENEELGRDRTFSWGDAGFEEILHSLGRNRAFSDMSTASDLSIRPIVLVPPELSAEGQAVRLSSFPPPLPITEQPVSVSNFHINQMNSNAQLQFPQQFHQLLIQSNAFIPNQLMPGQMLPILPLESRENSKIGAYTRQERQEKIAKYRAKRSQRVFRKQVKYDCRKKLADTRPRVKGRFVTKLEDEPGDEDVKPPPQEGEGSGEEELEVIHGETSCESFA